MSYFFKFGAFSPVVLAAVLCLTGCPQSQDQAASSSNQIAQDPTSDPASANLAPVNSNTSASYNGSNSGSGYAQAPDQSNAQNSEDPGYGAQPVEYADQPPPPLPNYDQPSDPGDDDLWTPGYWSWGQDGYYWVPGVWVQAPYEGALWTPGYWGFWNNRYGFYGGYWGPHIGYYGGVDYGFGYVGVGYQGGYWGDGHFNYNRSVNNLDVNIVHNAYSHPVSENRGGSRVSFTGGSGGLQVRARPAELAARHEQHAPPMTAQLQNERAASTNRNQFASVNHGRPANLAIKQPLAADRNVHMPAEVQAHNQATAQQQHQVAQQQQAVQQQHQAAQQQQQRQVVQQQHQAAQQQQQRRVVQQQHQAAQQQQQRRVVQQQHQAPPIQQQRQATPQQQHYAAPQQQHRAVQQQQHQVVQQQHQIVQQQRQAAPQQHQTPQQHQAENHPKG